MSHECVREIVLNGKTRTRKSHGKRRQEFNLLEKHRESRKVWEQGERKGSRGEMYLHQFLRLSCQLSTLFHKEFFLTFLKSQTMLIWTHIHMNLCTHAHKHKPFSPHYAPGKQNHHMPGLPFLPPSLNSPSTLLCHYDHVCNFNCSKTRIP